MQLPAGTGTITLQLADENDTIDIKSVELISVKEKKNIEKRVAAFKGDATWMKDAGYGIMLQVGDGLILPKGIKNHGLDLQRTVM